MAVNMDFTSEEVTSSQMSIVDEDEMAKIQRDSILDSTSRATKYGVKNYIPG